MRTYRLHYGPPLDSADPWVQALEARAEAGCRVVAIFPGDPDGVGIATAPWAITQDEDSREIGFERWEEEVDRPIVYACHWDQGYVYFAPRVSAYDRRANTFVGGAPTFADPRAPGPTCPTCGDETRFVAQLGEVMFDVTFGDAGVLMVYLCPRGCGGVGVVNSC